MGVNLGSSEGRQKGEKQKDTVEKMGQNHPKLGFTDV